MDAVESVSELTNVLGELNEMPKDFMLLKS